MKSKRIDYVKGLKWFGIGTLICTECNANSYCFVQFDPLDALCLGCFASMVAPVLGGTEQTIPFSFKEKVKMYLGLTN